MHHTKISIEFRGKKIGEKKEAGVMKSSKRQMLPSFNRLLAAIKRIIFVEAFNLFDFEMQNDRIYLRWSEYGAYKRQIFYHCNELGVRFLRQFIISKRMCFYLLAFGAIGCI